MGVLLVAAGCGGGAMKSVEPTEPKKVGLVETKKDDPQEITRGVEIVRPEEPEQLKESEPVVASLVAEAPSPNEEAGAPAKLKNESATKGAGGAIGLGNPGAMGQGAGQSAGSTAGGRGQVRGATATATGAGLSAEIIQRVIRQSFPRLRACYQKELAKKPELGGAMVTAFTISPKGTVSQVQVSQSNLQNAELNVCIVDVMRSLQFPPPEGGETIQVRYPLAMSPDQDP